MDPVVRTPRLVLRPLTLDDFEPFYQRFVADPSVIRFYHAYRQPMTDAARRARARRDFFDHFARGLTDHGYITWALTPGPALNAQAGTLIGWAGILTPALDAGEWGPELAYMLASDWQGMGLATEAAAAVVRDAWLRYALPRLHAVVDAPNAASIRVLQKLGFTRHGRVEVYGSPDMLVFTRTPPTLGEIGHDGPP